MSALTSRIEPFAALTYNLAKVGALDSVVAPPYDLIDRSLQDQLYARSAYNVIRLELNREPDPYGAAAATLHQWLAEGALVRMPHPAIYHYTQEFHHEERTFRRTALLARVRLDEFSSGRVLPHERTFPKAKADRLQLLEATQTNVSPIFGVYRSADAALAALLAAVGARTPLMVATDGRGVENAIRPIESSEEIALVQRVLADSPLLIADGHHRYETALEYRRRRRAATAGSGPQPYDYVMMALVAFDDPGLVILPTHRVARRLDRAALASFDARCREHFSVEELQSPQLLLSALAASGPGALGVSLAQERKLRLLKIKESVELAEAMPELSDAVRRLDVSILHSLIFERIFGLQPETIRTGGNLEYTIDGAAALAEVATGAIDGAFLMNPPTVQDIVRVSAAGAVMPEKSTYFYPKLLTGLLFNPLFE